MRFAFYNFKQDASICIYVANSKKLHYQEARSASQVLLIHWHHQETRKSRAVRPPTGTDPITDPPLNYWEMWEVSLLLAVVHTVVYDLMLIWGAGRWKAMVACIRWHWSAWAHVHFCPAKIPPTRHCYRILNWSARTFHFAMFWCSLPLVAKEGRILDHAARRWQFNMPNEERIEMLNE